jgi:hypothetical protein
MDKRLIMSQTLTALTCALALGACGSSKSSPKTSSGKTPAATTESSTDTSPTKTTKTTKSTKDAKAISCSPSAAKGQVIHPRVVRQGSTAKIKVGRNSADLRILHAVALDSLRTRFGTHETVGPPSDGALIGVTYGLTNRGPGPIKPAHDLNAQALIAGASGKLYRTAEVAECKVPLSASWAVATHGRSPQAAVAVGKRTTTAVVFLVPAHYTTLAFTLRAQHIRVLLKVEKR